MLYYQIFSKLIQKKERLTWSLSYFRVYEKGRIQFLLINPIMLNLPVLCLSTIEKESSLADLPFFLTYQHYDFIKYFNRRCKPSSSSSVFKIQNIRSGCSLLSTMEIISPLCRARPASSKKRSRRSLVFS